MATLEVEGATLEEKGAVLEKEGAEVEKEKAAIKGKEATFKEETDRLMKEKAAIKEKEAALKENEILKKEKEELKEEGASLKQKAETWKEEEEELKNDAAPKMASLKKESAKPKEENSSLDMVSGKERREFLSVFTWDHNTNVSQIVKHLRDISASKKNTSFCYISHNEEDIWKCVADKSYVIVLCLSYSVETLRSDLSNVRKFLDSYRENHGKIKVAITDVENITLERQITECWMEECCCDCELLTLSKAEMRSLIEHKIDPLSAERRMANKLRHIHQIIQEAAERNCKQELKKSGLGIFSRSTIGDDLWIKKLLHSSDFRDFVTCFDISTGLNDIKMFFFGILYFTITKKREQSNDIDDTDVKLIQQYRSHLGKDNVIIVMDDVEDSSDQEKIRILESHPDIEDLYHNLFLFSPQETSKEYEPLLSSLLNINKPSQPQADVAKTKQGKLLSIDWQKMLPSMFQLNRRVLGIFSRSPKEEYIWLESMLKPRFTEVKCFYIANNGFRQFMDEVSQCKFGILYHTKNKGRINVTDVSDSLYDRELEYMSKKLGKQQVCVIIDDLDNNSEEERNQILHSQPKILNLAKDLYLLKRGSPQQKVRDLEQKKTLFFS